MSEELTDAEVRKLYDDNQEERRRLEPIIIELIEQLRDLNSKGFKLEYLLAKKLNINLEKKMGDRPFQYKKGFNGTLSTPSKRKPITNVEW